MLRQTWDRLKSANYFGGCAGRAGVGKLPISIFPAEEKERGPENNPNSATLPERCVQTETNHSPEYDPPRTRRVG